MKEEAEAAVNAGKALHSASKEAAATLKEAFRDASKIIRERTPANTGHTGFDAAFDAAEASIEAVERVQDATTSAGLTLGFTALSAATTLGIDPVDATKTAKKRARQAVRFATELWTGKKDKKSSGKSASSKKPKKSKSRK